MTELLREGLVRRGTDYFIREFGPEDLPRAAGVLDGETFRRVRHVVTENQRVLDTARCLCGRKARPPSGRRVFPVSASAGASREE